MNAGVIAARYAKALLKYVLETGNGDKAYSQACVIVLRMEEIPQLREYVEEHSGISDGKKRMLIETALGEELLKEISDFLNLVMQRRRTGYILRMLYSFLSLYREASNIKVGRLVTALPAEGLKEKMEELFHERTGAEVRLETKVDPEIMGGFIFELDDWRLVLVGDGRDGKMLRAMAEDLGLERVSFEGMKVDVKPYYRKASIVCLTSDTEGWPLVLTEGQAQGCIGIAFGTTSGIREILSPDGECGFVVPSSDESAFAETFVKVASMNEEDLRRIRVNGLRKRAEYVPEVIAAKWKALFDSLVSR